MTKFGDKTFNGPTWNAPKDCTHGWYDARGKCVKCGERPKGCGVIGSTGMCFREAGHLGMHTVYLDEYTSDHWWDAELLARQESNGEGAKK